MKIPFNTPARKWLVAALAVALAIGYVGLSASRYAASRFGSRVDLSSLKRAAWLDPGNADYRNHLGRYYNLVARDPASAVGQFRQAVQLNPHSARYWFDLASAYQVLGDTENQTAALERAIQADSMTPDVAWEAANLYLVQGQNAKAQREFRVVMANDTSLAASAIRFCWRINPDVDLLLRDVVPPTADANIAFLTLLEQNVASLLSKAANQDEDTDFVSVKQQIDDEAAGTVKVWNALIQTNQSFDERHANEYFSFLIQLKKVDQAVQVWQQTANRFGHSAYLPAPGNLIVDGQLTLPVLNAGFDWQYQKQSGVHLVLDPLESSPHQNSLMITFDGPGISDAGFFQYVPVQPNTAYEFSAHYRTKGEQDGAGAPHLEIRDMYGPAIYYQSDELKAAKESEQSDELRGEESWKPVNGEFTTGPDCILVVLHIPRLPAGKPIRGNLSVGNFHLVRKPS